MSSRIPMGLTILAVVFVVPPLPVFAGDNPMPANNGQRTESKGVRMLLSQNLRERQQGRREISQERAELVSQLSAIIDDPQNHLYRRDAVESAMTLLGELRAPEAVDVLVSHIGFPHVPHPEAGELACLEVDGGVFGKTIGQLLPAVPALIRIGEPSVEAVIKRLSTTDNVLEIEACRAVLKKLDQSASLRARLQKALKHAAPAKQEQLKDTLQMLDEHTSAHTEPSPLCAWSWGMLGPWSLGSGRYQVLTKPIQPIREIA